MASVEREPKTGVWGQSPQQGPGAEPMIRGAKADSILAFERQKKAANLTCHSSHWRSIQQRTSKASYQYTLGKLPNDVFNFVFLDYTISHFGLTNCILDCTLRISPEIKDCIVLRLEKYTRTHTFRFNGHFPVEPGLAGCPLNSLPFISGLRILLGQT